MRRLIYIVFWFFVGCSTCSIHRELEQMNQNLRSLNNHIYGEEMLEPCRLVFFDMILTSRHRITPGECARNQDLLNHIMNKIQTERERIEEETPTIVTSGEI